MAATISIIDRRRRAVPAVPGVDASAPGASLATTGVLTHPVVQGQPTTGTGWPRWLPSIAARPMRPLRHR